MRDIPIIFSAPMTLALLAGQKTMTRRRRWTGNLAADGKGFRESAWSRVSTGDRLWTREALTFEDHHLRFAADKSNVDCSRSPDGYRITRGSISGMFMPRWASRLTLIVTATKIEPLHAISEADAKAEGWQRQDGLRGPDVAEVHRDAARDWFSDLWESLHGIRSWAANPEVVAISFRVVESNIDTFK